MAHVDTHVADHAILIAVRCWSAARRSHEPIQSALSRALDHLELTILSPVLDSLFRFYEIALGRCIVAGRDAGPSDDERLLQDLIADRAISNQCLDCGKSARDDLQCALCSARIMLCLSATDRRSPS